MSFDREPLDFLNTVRSERTTLVREVCVVCAKPIHKTPLAPGEPTEWRHDSSGHVVSWSPERHIAGTARVRQHAHKWDDGATGVLRCTVEGCDSEAMVRELQKPEVKLTEKEAHVARSRKRGGEARREQTKAKKARRPRA